MIFIEALIALLVFCLVWLWLMSRIRPKAPANPAEDPLSYVPAPNAKGPKGRSGAVALQEPEDDGPVDAFPPRRA
jgi:hypothetical protein